MKTRNIILLLMAVIAIIAGIIVISIPYDNDVSSESLQSNSEIYDIPVHIYEVWDSTAIIIHGNVDRQDEAYPVTIQIRDKRGEQIESAEIIPDEKGRFVYGVSKFVPEGFGIKPIWNNTESYDVFATSKHHPPSSTPTQSSDVDNIPLQKDRVPLTSEQISNMSHQQIIDTIGKWNDIGGNSPFTVIAIIGINEQYQLGQSMPFFIQKSGYGNPCYDQGVMIFDKTIKENIGVNFYFGLCDPEKKEMESFDYMIPYNTDGFPKLKPITTPGEYVMVAATSDISNKVKQEFSVVDSDFVYDYYIEYTLHKGSPDNTKTIKIDLNSGDITIQNDDGTTYNALLDSDTLDRLILEIQKNDIATNPLNSMWYGQLCDTCNFGHIKLLIGDTLVNQILWDDNKSDPEANPFRSYHIDSSTYFNLVDCIASKNGVERSWIDDDDDLPLKKYKESQMSCNDLVKLDQTQANLKPYAELDYDFWVDNKPKKVTVSDRSGQLGSTHEHASLLVKIFGDKFDFSKPDYQIKSPRIHFEGQDGNTIHMHSTEIPLSYLFDSIGIGLDDQCYIFTDDRKFCTNNDYFLTFYINGEQVDSILDHVISQGDRILISYGPENISEINEQLAELELQEIIS